MNIKLPNTSPWHHKDQAKADICTKFIGRGSSRSSTAAYALAFGELANCGSYSEDDIIFVSVEGNRRNRVPLDASELQLAIDARASFITDNSYHRERTYNIGERELADLLIQAGYYVKSNTQYYALWLPNLTEV